MDPYIRQSRSATHLSEGYTEDPTGFGTKLITLSDTSAQKLAEDTSESSVKRDPDVVVAVRVSSSVGRQSSKRIPIRKTSKSEGQNLLAIEEQPSLVAESNKNEFSVEESEPITSDSDVSSKDYGQEYPAAVRSLPKPENAYSEAEAEGDKDKLQNYQRQTVIYHNNRDPARARSVSYSTVVQSLPQVPKAWEERKPEELLDRKERHFDGPGFFSNSFDAYKEAEKAYNASQKLPQDSMAESKDYYVTSKYNPPEYNESTDKIPVGEENAWRKTQEIYNNPAAPVINKNQEPTERNWELQSKAYTPEPTLKTPMIYGQPEQNYEVDESVSLMTNGRTHGIQTFIKGVSQKVPSATPALDGKNLESTTDADGQKVGYVVEGRNYRKYRVEERTSDGFIVGEYGVVSHNDGTLRGVRYTADGTINPRLIYDALMKFLSL